MELTPGYKQTEIGVMPTEWDVRHLRDVAQIRSGIAKNAGVAVSDPISVHYLRVANVQDGFLDLSDMSQLEVSRSDLGRFSVLPGDVLMNEGGDRDKLGRGSVWRGEFEPCVHQNHVFVVRCGASVNPEFLTIWSSGAIARRHFLLAGNQTTNLASINKTSLGELPVIVPGESEQRAIAEVLSDVDGLIEALEKLIAKKRAIKQAAMQQLLTGKTRLPGFTGKWTARQIEELAAVDPENLSSATEPSYAFNYISLEQVDAGRLLGFSEEVFRFAPSRARRVLRHGDVLMSTVRPNLMAHFHYRSQIPNAVCSTGFAVLRARPGVADPRFLFAHLFGYSVNQQIEKTLAGSNYPAINGRDVRILDVPCPPTVEEQASIATVLSDMDAEIEALERRGEKTRQIKQGMMQQLLTGRIRLVTPELQDAAAQTDSDGKASKPHSWAFNEAVVISTLAKHFGKEDFPLGRKRYTKLSYLLHRHAEQQAEGYLKKAAGPYNPKTRYGGPERIALESGYIREHKNGPYTGFVASDNIEKAEGYFEKWYGPDAIQWLNQVRKKRNDDLELLATVDMAAEELRAEDQAVDVDAVKAVIRSHPEWKAKLDRAVFSDANIARAIEESRRLLSNEVDH